MSNFWGSIRNYGLAEGLSLYVKLKFGSNRESISTSKLPYKVHFRPGTMDYLIFKQIFLQLEFNISILDGIGVEKYWTWAQILGWHLFTLRINSRKRKS